MLENKKIRLVAEKIRVSEKRWHPGKTRGKASGYGVTPVAATAPAGEAFLPLARVMPAGSCRVFRNVLVASRYDHLVRTFSQHPVALFRNATPSGRFGSTTFFSFFFPTASSLSSSCAAHAATLCTPGAGSWHIPIFPCIRRASCHTWPDAAWSES